MFAISRITLLLALATFVPRYRVNVYKGNVNLILHASSFCTHTRKKTQQKRRLRIGNASLSIRLLRKMGIAAIGAYVCVYCISLFSCMSSRKAFYQHRIESKFVAKQADKPTCLQAYILPRSIQIAYVH